MVTTNLDRKTNDLHSKPEELKKSRKEIKVAPHAPDAIKRLVNGEFKNVVFLVGAGISTAAGIPDFRTPGTGFYANIERLDLPFVEAVFTLDYLRENPEAFYTIAKDLNPKQYEPTTFHKFIKWVDDQGYLKRCYTQNIDTLERQVGINPDKIIEAHGSFHGSHCIDCHAEFDQKKMNEILSSDSKEIPRCKKCQGLVKPDIVFFGESLPSRFFEAMEDDFDDAIDLVIVAGTTLQIQPFAQLPEMVPMSCSRVLFNLEKVGNLGKRQNDALVIADLADIADLLPFLLSDSDASGDSSSDSEDKGSESRDDKGSDSDEDKQSENTETKDPKLSKAEPSESEEVDSISGKLDKLEI